MKYKLICFDMDGVIFRKENFWMEVHEVFGSLKAGKELTKKYLHSNYDRLVEEVVVKLWKGKDAKPYYKLVDSLKYIQGAKKAVEEIKEKGYITAIISAGSIHAARRAQKDLGIDHIFANELVIKNNKISGEFLWPIGAGKGKKAEIMKSLCRDLGITTKECIYIGDSDTDIKAFEEAGLSIAFNPKTEGLEKAATHIVDSDNLADVLKYIP